MTTNMPGLRARGRRRGDRAERGRADGARDEAALAGALYLRRFPRNKGAGRAGPLVLLILFALFGSLLTTYK